MQRDIEKAAADEVVKYLTPMVRANPGLLVRSLGQPEMLGIAVAAMAGAIKRRSELELAEELNDELPPNMLGL